MEERVVLSVERYNELIRKALAYDLKREELLRWGSVYEMDKVLFNIPDKEEE